jgi:excisionase family DNA binding protein
VKCYRLAVGDELVTVLDAAAVEEVCRLAIAGLRITGATAEVHALVDDLDVVARVHRASAPITALPPTTSASFGNDDSSCDGDSQRLSTSATSRRLGVTERRVRQLVAEGHLQAVRIGRGWSVDRSSIETYQQRKQR